MSSRSDRNKKGKEKVEEGSQPLHLHSRTETQYTTSLPIAQIAQTRTRRSMVCRSSRKYRRAYQRALIDIYEGRYHASNTRYRSRTEEEAYCDALINTFDPVYGGGPGLRRPAPAFGGYGGYGGYAGYGGGYGGGTYGMGGMNGWGGTYDSPVKVVYHTGSVPAAAAGPSYVVTSTEDMEARDRYHPNETDINYGCCTVM